MTLKNKMTLLGRLVKTSSHSYKKPCKKKNVAPCKLHFNKIKKKAPERSSSEEKIYNLKYIENRFKRQLRDTFS